MNRGAFTLIEVLAVIAIVSLAAAVAAGGLAGASDSARWRETIAELRDLDARARLAARREGALEIALDGDGRRVTAGDLEVLLPASVAVQIAPAPPAEAVTVDRRGCGPDYRVTVSGPRETREWTVLGLTGVIVETGVAP